MTRFVSLISKRGGPPQKKPPSLSLYGQHCLAACAAAPLIRSANRPRTKRLTVDVERLESYLTPFLPLTNHAKADAKNQCSNPETVSKKLLSALRGLRDDRYEIPRLSLCGGTRFLESIAGGYSACWPRMRQIPVESRLLEKVPEPRQRNFRGKTIRAIAREVNP